MAQLVVFRERRQRYIVSGFTPFTVEDCEALAYDAASVIRLRSPGLASEFLSRGWSLPASEVFVFDTRAQGLTHRDAINTARSS